MSIDHILKSAHFGSFLHGWLPEEKIDIYSVKGLKTAYWQFRPPHKIAVGADVKNYIKTQQLQNTSDYYVGSYFYHELAHAKYTERNKKKITDQLALNKVPFSLYNLFEDARIEEKWRKETGRDFKWAEYENMPLTKVLNDEELFFYMIQAEGIEKIKKINNTSETTTLTLKGYKKNPDRFILYSSAHKCEKYVTIFDDFSKVMGISTTCEMTEYTIYPKNSALKPFYKDISKNITYKRDAKICHVSLSLKTDDDKLIKLDTHAGGNNSHEFTLAPNSNNFEMVANFYQKTIEAKDSMEVIDICAEWMLIHPNSENNIEISPLLRGKDTSDREIAQIESDKIQQLVYEDPCEKTLSTGDISQFFHGNDNEPDKNQVNRLATIFTRILKRGNQSVSTELPQKRLNIRNYALGQDKIYNKNIKDNGKKVKKNLSLIIDCSGSMRQKPLSEGKIFLAVLNKLATSGLIDCNVILSGTYENTHLCATYQLPLKDEDFLKKLCTVGGEGFATTIKKVTPILKKSDYVFIYTDGCIGDKLDNDYAHKQGIYTYGLYAGEYDVKEELLKFFDCAISRSSVEELINALVTKIK